MHCINERFLDGCNFDEAYQNPCHSSEPDEGDDEEHDNSEIHMKNTNDRGGGKDSKSARLEFDDQSENKSVVTAPGSNSDNSGSGFNEEQQMKLRKIASTRAGLLNLIGAARAIEPLINNQESPSGASQTQEKIFVYLLIAMVVLTILVSIVMIVLIVNWTKLKLFTGQNQNQNQELNGQNASALVQQQQQQHQQQSTQLGNNYMSNQRQHYSNHRHPHRHSRSGTVSSSYSRSSKPLGSVSVVVSKSSRRHTHGVDNSAL